MKRTSMLFAAKRLGLFCLILLGSVSCGETKAREPGQVLGGPCHYKTYPGTAEMVSVQKVAALKNAKGSGDGYDVKFVFHAETEPEEAFARTEGKTHRLLLINGTYPRNGFLKKYGIEVGKVFPCHLEVIVKGTCTPVVYTFPTIDLTDYEANR